MKKLDSKLSLILVPEWNLTAWHLTYQAIPGVAFDSVASDLLGVPGSETGASQMALQFQGQKANTGYFLL